MAIGIEDPATAAEAWGSELFPIAFNDGYDRAEAGLRLPNPDSWCRFLARKVGLTDVEGFAHGFVLGYQTALDQRRGDWDDDDGDPDDEDPWEWTVTKTGRPPRC